MSNKLPIFYSFRRCPYAIRARLALYYSGASVELREVVLRDKPSELIACSEKGTVPVLVLGDGKVIDESIDIIRWALTENDPQGWWHDLSISEQTEANYLINGNDFSFKKSLDNYKYADRFPEENIQDHKKNAENYLNKLEKRLIEKQFLINNKISIADISIFPFVRQYCFVDEYYFYKLPYKNLQKWLKYFLKSNLFISVMDKYPQWLYGNDEQIFPHKTINKTD